MKRFVKCLARPFTRPLFSRVDARVQLARDELGPVRDDLAAIRQHFAPMVTRVQSHDRLTNEHAETIAELRRQISAINNHLPILLNTISSQPPGGEAERAGAAGAAVGDETAAR